MIWLIMTWGKARIVKTCRDEADATIWTEKLLAHYPGCKLKTLLVEE